MFYSSSWSKLVYLNVTVDFIVVFFVHWNAILKKTATYITHKATGGYLSN